MSIINQMHQELKSNAGVSPILSAMPKKKGKQKFWLIILIVLLLASSLGLAYLIYNRKPSEEKISNAVNAPVKKESLSVVLATPVVTIVPIPVTPAPAASESQVVEAVSIASVVTLPPIPQPTATLVPTLVPTLLPSPIPTVAPKTAVKALSKQAEVNIPAVSSEDKKVGHLAITKSKLTKSERGTIHLKRAEKALAKEDLGLAAEEKRKALSIQPELHDVRKSIARYYYGIGEQNIANSILMKGAVDFPEHADFNLMLSRIALKNGDRQKAFLYLDQNPPVVEGNLDYHVSYAILAQKFKYYDKSELLFEGLLTQRPSNGRWRMSLAIAQDKQGKQTLAASNYKKALLQVDLSSKAKKYINQRLTYLENQ